MTDPEAFAAYRRAIIPHQLAAARATVRHLEAEAGQIGVALGPGALPVGDMALARQARAIASSDAVTGIFAAPEWEELHEDGKEWVIGIVRETVARSVAPLLFDALWALIEVEPSNSDDPDDAEQCAAWRQAHDIVALATRSPNFLISGPAPLGRSGAASVAPARGTNGAA